MTSSVPCKIERKASCISSSRFPDAWVKIEENQITTDLFSKSTDSQNYLMYNQLTHIDPRTASNRDNSSASVGPLTLTHTSPTILPPPEKRVSSYSAPGSHLHGQG